MKSAIKPDTLFKIIKENRITVNSGVTETFCLAECVSTIQY